MALRRVAYMVIGFAAASGIGLLIDLALFLVLIQAKLTPTFANLLSATAAVTLVYFATVHRVFSYRGRFLLPLFVGYLAYQAAAVTAASLAVGWLARYWMPPALAKLAILPVTFSANFLFMSLLTRRRLATIAESRG